MDRFQNLAEILSILSAMIAPVVLISACASLVLSTSNRLARAVERTRLLLEKYEEAARQTGISGSVDREDESMLLYDELILSTRRSRLLQRALASEYVAMSAFIGASVVLGFVAIINENYAWLPLLLMMIGGGLLFYSGIMLVAEIFLTHRAINMEMDFVLSRTKRQASQAVVEYQQQKKSMLKEAQS
jgi:hypothetical protein